MTKQINIAQIQLASPKQISKWTLKKFPDGTILGYIKSKETLAYRTLKPVPGGLFCERIFGPIKNWQCMCGRHRPHSSVRIPLPRPKGPRPRCSMCLVEIQHSNI